MYPILDMIITTNNSNTQVTFQNMISYVMSAYDANVEIPTGANFLSVQNSWFEKFTGFFPFPYYEFFVTTYPTAILNQISLPASCNQNISYSNNPTTINVVAGKDFSNTKMGGSQPTVVARLMPLPSTSIGNQSSTISVAQTYQPATVSTAYWDGLFDSQSALDYLPPPDTFLDSSISFGTDEIANFYQIQPLQFASTFGIGPAVQAASVLMPMAYDAYSNHRYGWKPYISNIEWLLSNPTNKTITPTYTWEGIGYQLLGKITSYFEPTPVMAKASYRHVLMPSVFPGTKFKYYPYKGESHNSYQNTEYEFYVEGVAHTFVFGGRSETTLTLSRGVPTYIWKDSQKSLELLTGALQRINGTHQAKASQSGDKYLLYASFVEAQKIANALSSTFSNPKP
jgi:hypothetical protein